MVVFGKDQLYGCDTLAMGSLTRGLSCVRLSSLARAGLADGCAADVLGFLVNASSTRKSSSLSSSDKLEDPAAAANAAVWVSVFLVLAACTGCTGLLTDAGCLSVLLCCFKEVSGLLRFTPADIKAGKLSATAAAAA